MADEDFDVAAWEHRFNAEVRERRFGTFMFLVAALTLPVLVGWLLAR